MKKKIILCIADGLGDRPCEELGGKTPLEFANTKNLDKIAMNGTTGIMDLYQAGTPVGTDLGHMILFGYGIEDYPGRGPIEAFGNNLELISGDVAFRCNFATVDDKLNVKDRRAGRIREGTAELAQALNGMEVRGVKVFFKEATEHRAVMVLRGKNLSSEVADTDPKIEGKKIYKCVGTDNSKEADFTADVVNEIIMKANRILKEHPLNREREKIGLKPANAILTRGAGIMPHVEKITEKLGFKASCIAAEHTVMGAARLAGFEVVTDKSFTGNIDTDIYKKAEKALESIENNDFTVLHFKATDLMGHDNNPKGKAKAAELYDKMIGLVIEGIEKNIDEQVIIALAADHSTPCERREHSGEPVPIAICGNGIRRDNTIFYDEIECSRGGLGRIKGNDFNRILLDYLEVTIKRGN